MDLWSSFLKPEWPAAANIRACTTTRAGGVSLPPYDELNLGLHVHDEPDAVRENRATLTALLPEEPVWLEQVHGTRVLDLDHPDFIPEEADAVFTRSPGRVCCVMTADCLPVLLTDRAGTVVAAAHAGWRGLLEGVIEKTVRAMQVAPEDVLAWLGPAIGPQAFEVGADVRDAFMSEDRLSEAAFGKLHQGKYYADIYKLARRRLDRVGVQAIYGGDLCTFHDEDRFFSFRREKKTGRMASLIWMA